jgi:lipopolysaccharide/colanic/teichoic acid biosynthesis glycosyltransferase
MTIKRVIDAVIAGVSLACLLPLLAMIALAVRVTLGSPVLFRQLRPGLRERPFALLKFRSMRDGQRADGTLAPDAVRLTRFGRFLRRTSLDELPELINVLRGEMSLVGPRPLLMEYLPRYSPRQARRHEVLPGMTGLAQVSGRNRLSWEERFELDVWYVDHRTLWLDLTILFRTIGRVLSGDDVSQRGHATAEEFQGCSSAAGRHA